MPPPKSTFEQAASKAERFCAFQERCHEEVRRKISALGLSGNDAEKLLVHLIENGFLNEERFARAFARGRHNIKKWGRARIENELRARNISAANIRIAITEIADADYDETFEKLSAQLWRSITEQHPLKKRKKFCDALLRKGYESDRVYARAKALEMHRDQRN